MSLKYTIDPLHILPENDLKPHVKSKFCKCAPMEFQADNNQPLIIHNAWDGREFFENPKTTATLKL